MALIALAALSAGTRLARAEDQPGETHRPTPLDGGEVEARVSSFASLFRRSLLPGPAGAAVTTDTASPLYARFDLGARRLNTAWARKSLDIELSAWGNYWLIAPNYQAPWDGDLVTANVTDRVGPVQVRVGRQIVSQGAARFAHFDGVSLGARSDSGFGAFAYAGLTVLPHWAERPGYYQLGSARDTLLNQPDALPRPTRGGWWLGGAELSYVHGSIAGAAVSFHEQRESTELGRRDLGVNAHWTPGRLLDLVGRGLVDLDGARVAEAVLSAIFYPSRPLEVSAELRHVTPALMLSRQSVLAVFDTSPFDEAGGHVRYRLDRWVVLDGHAYLEMIGIDSFGVRTGLDAQYSPDVDRRILLRAGYRRVGERDNGYHSGHASLRWRFAALWAVAVNETFYLYDAPIHGVTTSNVEDVTVEWVPPGPWRVLLGSSVFSSPYARWDAQAVLRVSYSWGPREGRL